MLRHERDRQGFMRGRNQAVRLPNGFRLPGTEVRVTRMGRKIVLEPVDVPPFDVEAWWAEWDSIGADDFLGEETFADTPAEPDKSIDFG